MEKLFLVANAKSLFTNAPDTDAVSSSASFFQKKFPFITEVDPRSAHQSILRINSDYRIVASHLVCHMTAWLCTVGEKWESVDPYSCMWCLLHAVPHRKHFINPTTFQLLFWHAPPLNTSVTVRADIKVFLLIRYLLVCCRSNLISG